jgi:chromosome segregation ATPase
VGENSQLKRHNAELEAMRGALEERARAGDRALEAATQERETTSRDRAELEANRSALEAEARKLRERVSALEGELGVVRTQLHAAESALGDAGVMAGRLADTVAARDTAEKEAARLGEQLRDLERAMERMVGDMDAARGESATSAVLLDDLRARAEHAEQQAAAASERASSDRAAMEAQLNAVAQQMRAQADAYEEKLRAALTSSGGASADALNEVLSERDAYRQRLQETDAWVQQAQLHLEAFATERAQLDARAQEALSEAQARQAETHELYAQLAAAKQTIEQLTARAGGLEERLEQASRGSHPDPAALQEAQAELRALRAQLVQAQRGGPGQLPEEIEPLRWTLNAAIEQLTTLESREPGLGTHLRNLRLLAQALQRLSGR